MSSSVSAHWSTLKPNSSISITVVLDTEWSNSFTIDLFLTCSKAVVNSENDSFLANQLCSWYDMETYGLYKQTHDARAMILEETTFNGGSRYQVAKLCADEESTMPNNYITAMFNSAMLLERCLGKDAQLKQNNSERTGECLSVFIL